MARIKKKEFKLYVKPKWSKRFVFNGSFQYLEMAEWEMNKIKKDIFLANCITDFKIV